MTTPSGDPQLIRVLQVYRDYFTRLPGGIERHVSDLAHGLNENKLAHAEVLTAGDRRRPRVEHDGSVKVHFAAEFARVGGAPLAPAFPRLMRQGFQLIHLHSPNPTGELAALVARRNSSVILTYHADSDRRSLLSPIYRGFLDWYLQRCRRVIVSSDRLIQTSEVIARVCERRPDALEVIPMGVDLERFHPNPTDETVRLRENWGRRPTVLFVGRLRYYKGLHVLIEALKDLDALLVIVGDGEEGPRIRSLARRTLGDRARFLGEVPDDSLPEIYRAADLFCLPSVSRSEAYGIAAIEAMASGLPVVTTDVGTGTSVVNVDGVTGHVVPPSDPSALRSALRQLLEDSSLRSELGQSGRSRAEESFGLHLMLRRIATVYEEVLSEAD